MWNVFTVCHSHMWTSTKEYDNMVNNPEIRKSKLRARDLENEISKLQQESGYPYVVNIDTANRVNPIDGRLL